MMLTNTTTTQPIGQLSPAARTNEINRPLAYLGLVLIAFSLVVFACVQVAKLRARRDPYGRRARQRDWDRLTR